MASFAAALIGAGTSKSGWPMLRLTGSLRLRARSNILRMPEDSIPRMRSAIQRSAASEGMAAISFKKKNRPRTSCADCVHGSQRIEHQGEEGKRLWPLLLLVCAFPFLSVLIRPHPCTQSVYEVRGLFLL